MLRLIQSCLEFIPKSDIRNVGPGRRGIYVLYKKQGRLKAKRIKDRFDVLYIGMADFSIKSRLYSHARSKRKGIWTYFSAYAVWPNITKQEIEELEGLFRHLYRYDGRANVLNLQKGFKAIRRIKAKDAEEWQQITKPFKLRGNN